MRDQTSLGGGDKRRKNGRKSGYAPGRTRRSAVTEESSALVAAAAKVAGRIFRLEPLERRVLMSGTVAAFAGGNGTTSADQFLGAGGSGWAGAWTEPTLNGAFNATTTVTAATPLFRMTTRLSA